MKGEKSVVHTLKLGSLYLDNKPVTPGVKYHPGQMISFGIALSRKAISWVPVNGLLIAHRCLLNNISWDDIDSQSLVFGKEISLHGFRFRSRLLKVGNKKGVPNEWDAALDIVGDSDELWHWEDLFFWGQEVIKHNESNRANRWCGSERNHNYNSANYRDRDLGFRPVLEPLPTDISAFKQDQEILVIGSNGAVIGNLEDLTQYDIILRPKPRGLVGRASFAGNMRDGTVAVDRSRILSIAHAYS